MASYFVPYQDGEPALLEINGHRLVILTEDKKSLQDGLSLFGADSLETVTCGDSEEESEELLRELAEEVNGGVVVAPNTVTLHELLYNLQNELPWLH